MNAVMTYATAADQMQRYDAIRRKNAESAYDRNIQYNGRNQKVLEELEALLTGKNEPENVLSDQKVQRDQPDSQGFQQLDAGQVKQIILPLGKTLEETIASWRDVRAEANSVPDPTTADHLLAANASAKIIQTEAQIALQKRNESVSRSTTIQQQAKNESTTSMELPSALDRETLLMQKRYQHAISSYSYQVKAKQNGFQLEWPSFYKIA